MGEIQKLIQEVAKSRYAYLAQVINVSEEQSKWKPEANSWNITEITEHLFWAEHAGIFGMWKRLQAIRTKEVTRTYDFEHKDRTIEQIIEMTWQSKEKVPEVANPRMGGPLSFWLVSLSSLQEVLASFGNELQEEELRLKAQAHPISGDLDFHQRFEFLRFHIERHTEQTRLLLTKMNG
ncbi:MAG: DinB family protein [Algoriphagus aquaeductus]|uniref:DinB family protein n=1 Tax=Algoriphagus aquaeductus TaxID=475299 RepID=UPI00391DCF19